MIDQDPVVPVKVLWINVALGSLVLIEGCGASLRGFEGSSMAAAVSLPFVGSIKILSTTHLLCISLQTSQAAQWTLLVFLKS